MANAGLWRGKVDGNATPREKEVIYNFHKMQITLTDTASQGRGRLVGNTPVIRYNT
jgi:hypothetical protein